MMQTQQLLAAVQAQAKLANPGPPSLMGNAPYGRSGGRMMNQQRGGRFNRNDRQRQGGYNRRDDRKRRYSPPPRPFKRERKDGDAARKDQNVKKTTTQTAKVVAKKDVKQDAKETKARSPTKGTEGKDAKNQESETKLSKNAADEDIQELIKTNYDGKRYWCSLCKIVCLKSKNIYKHFLSERHVKASIEKQGKVFDPEIMKKQEVQQDPPKARDISELLTYVCSTKQTARKENNDIYISSLTDCTVKIVDFTTQQDFMGSEFVKAVSGFKCQMCKNFMRHGNEIIQHLKGKKHSSNYEKYLKDHPDYLVNQRDVNKNLVDMLKEDEGKDVVLQESNGDARKAESSQQAKSEEETDLNMEGLDSSEVDDNSKMADEASFNDSALHDSIQDYSIEENEKKEADDGKVEESEAKEQMEIEDVNEAEKEEGEKKQMEDEQKEKNTGEREKRVSMEADEEEEEFPLLGPINPVQYEPIEQKAEVEAKGAKVEAKTPEVDAKPEQNETPETPSEPAVESEETEDLTPSRRGRKARRGRGATKATRGRRRTPRAAKNVKKPVEVVELEDEIAEPDVGTSEPREELNYIPIETEKEPDTETPPAEAASDPVEVAPSSQETGEGLVSPRGKAGDVDAIDGFEVIDEIEDGEEDDSEDDD
ncbi:zinc finger protein 318-like isoform X2 [Dendronephthya gigantea]|nr:zinc finger protein 318-like isoform X2 [Dendronephthya gigantea]